jgi:predicted acetyltransferase
VSLLLRPFRPEDEAVAVAAHRALARDDYTFLLGYVNEMPWLEWIQERERIRAGTDIPSDWVRAAFLAAEVDGSLVGRASIRFGLNEWLARYGGHIGYVVLPEFRRLGYATEILRQAIEVARQEGVDRVLVICDQDNIGSAAIIERCGGVFEGLATSEDGNVIRRYWI